MDLQLSGICVENFKSYGKLTEIPFSALSVLMGANSSGKSAALQTLLVLKQTVECNSPNIDLLLSGKYVTLGEFDDVINNEKESAFSFGIRALRTGGSEEYDDNGQFSFFWRFENPGEEGICLKEVKYAVGNSEVIFSRANGRIFDIYVNGERTILSIQIDNLKLVRLFINYNRKLNDLFYNFLNELEECFSSSKRIRTDRNGIVAFDRLDDFYAGLIRNSVYGDAEQTGIDLNPGTGDLAAAIRELIDKFSELQGGELDYIFGSTAFREYIIRSQVANSADMRKFYSVVKKYSNLYSSITSEDIDLDSRKEYDWGFLNQLHVRKEDEEKYYLVSEVYSNYGNILDEIINQIYYLGPIREAPRGQYNIGFETVPKYVGTTGAYFPSVLQHENKEREFILPDGGTDTMSLSDALDEWAAHLDVASEIKVERNNSFGFSVSIYNMRHIRSDIMNVGIGTSQVLPVLIMGLLSEEGECLIFEQPELHLHPYSQSRLADFFAALAKKGRKVIVETHSEHFLLRLRYLVLSGKIGISDVTVNFFQYKDCTRVSQGVLSPYGNFEYPEDFIDETQQLLDDLVNTAFFKRDK